MDKVISILSGAHPLVYFGLLILAGMGFPVSEDALGIWLGNLLARGDNPYPAFQYILAMYFGAVFSDVMAFGFGRLANRNLGSWVRDRLFRDPKKVDKALSVVRRYGTKAGFVQRFAIGARLPICFFSGYSGLSVRHFATGAAAGCMITLPLQILIGIMLPNNIESALQMVADYGLVVGATILLAIVLVLYRKMKSEEQSNPDEATP